MEKMGYWWLASGSARSSCSVRSEEHSLVSPSLSNLLFQVGFPLKWTFPRLQQRWPGQLQASILLYTLN